MASWLVIVVGAAALVAQTAAQVAFWRAYRARYPDRLPGGTLFARHLTGLGRDERYELSYRLNLLFRTLDDPEVESRRRLALAATGCTALVLVAVILAVAVWRT